MRGFLVGAALGAVLGIAGTLAWMPSPAPETTESARERTVPRVPPRGDGVRARAAVAAATNETAVAPPVVVAAPAPVAGDIDLESATIESLVALLARYETSKLPGDGRVHALVKTIARRFPEYRYPADVVRRWSKRNDGNVLAAALETWTDDQLMEELGRAFDVADPVFDPGLGARCGGALGSRGALLPSELCRRLLRDDEPARRSNGAWLSIYAREIDLDRMKEIAASDPAREPRSQALYAFHALVESGRLRPEDVTATIVAATRDPDESVRCAAASALVVAGADGARAAMEILARDGYVSEADDLVVAAVTDGLAGEVLDLRLGPRVDRHVAFALAELAPTRPELIRAMKARLPELVRAIASGYSDDTREFFIGVRVAGDVPSVAAYALDRDEDPDVRMAAIDALVADPASAIDGRDVARRIAADRREPSATRIDAIERLDQDVPEEQREAVHAEMRRFLEGLLAEESNERVRLEVARLLAE